MDAGAALTRLFGGLLLAAGVIIALSCGLCTGFFGIVAVVPLFTGKGADVLADASPYLIAGLVATGGRDRCRPGRARDAARAAPAGKRRSPGAAGVSRGV